MGIDADIGHQGKTRQAKDEERRVRLESMRTVRRHPKILYQYQEELSRTFAAFWKFCEYTGDTWSEQQLLQELATADSIIRDEIPTAITERYFDLDWSVFPRRAATILLVLLDMQATDGPRMIAPTRDVIARAELLEDNLHGWKAFRGKWSPSVVMDQYNLLHRMGILEEVIPGDGSPLNSWDAFYRKQNGQAQRTATIVELVRKPNQPRPGMVRGHVPPPQWSVHLGQNYTNGTALTPALSLPTTLQTGHSGTSSSVDHGTTVGRFEIEEAPALEPTALPSTPDRPQQTKRRARKTPVEPLPIPDLPPFTRDPRLPLPRKLGEVFQERGLWFVTTQDSLDTDEYMARWFAARTPAQQIEHLRCLGIPVQ